MMQVRVTTSNSVMQPGFTLTNLLLMMQPL